jgi:phage terminase Nu1 subunit (DNA packaging protein)
VSASKNRLADLKRLLKELDGEAGLTIAEARRRREAAEASIKEIELAERKGKLIDAHAVEQRWTEIAVRIQNAVMGLPAQIVNRLPAEWRRDVQAAATDEARKILTALSNDIRPNPTKGTKP